MSINEMLMAAAGTGGGDKLYVDDCFATHLYTGNGSTQTITNGIDLAGEGGMFWIKRRNGAEDHYLLDTARGDGSLLRTNSTDPAGTGWGSYFEFNNNGFSVTDFFGYINSSNNTYASWTFRKAPKFFDVVTYTGTGSARTVAHDLGTTPGMVIVKCTSFADQGWRVWHRSFSSNDNFLALNNTNAVASASTIWNSTAPTSTVFSVGTSDSVNKSGETYVAYLFAHDAGGFGDAGTDNIISCGSFTTDGSGNATVSLGYEPQWVLVKRTDSSTNGSWWMFDTMREMSLTNSRWLVANTSAAEVNGGGTAYLVPTATGFDAVNSFFNASATYIYMAIRRPMKTPTSGTEVFSPVLGVDATTATSVAFNAGFPVDLHIQAVRAGSGSYPLAKARLIGTNPGTYLTTSSNSAELADFYRYFDSNVGITSGIAFDWTGIVGWNFRRAPGFFDVVCYTGTGSNRTVTHNLGVAPELMIVKRRSAAEDWAVYSATIGNTNRLILNLNNASASAGAGTWNNTSPTATEFTVGTSVIVNGSGSTYVAYLFATVAGVSKVGSYTGNGSSQTINCGFSAGARFVLIKRTDSTGDWCVFDTARGIVSGNDPFLQLNSTAAEVTGEDAVDPANSGFIVNETTENLNVNNATYIFLAIS